MTNAQLIAEHLEAMEMDFNYDGTNLMTFAQWKRQNMKVKKGSKAFVKIPLWTVTEKKMKDEDGNIVKDENGKPKKEKNFYKKTSALFTPDQVEPMKTQKKKAS